MVPFAEFAAENFFPEMSLRWNLRGEATTAAHLALHIFSGVFQAVKEFVEVREPEAMVFATKRDELAGVLAETAQEVKH